MSLKTRKNLARILVVVFVLPTGVLVQNLVEKPLPPDPALQLLVGAIMIGFLVGLWLSIRWLIRLNRLAE